MTTGIEPSALCGLIVRHTSYGLGKIISVVNGQPRARFSDAEVEQSFGAQSLQNGTLLRVRLNPGARCEGLDGQCTVVRADAGAAGKAPYVYDILYDSGLRGTTTELELVPLPRVASSDPLQDLVALEPQGYALFEARERLQEALARVVRDGAGVSAMLSARIDLRPHQAYVAGVVLLDPRRRYILADEVGLGKTIEAGIVIHDLLSKNAASRVLVVCPGALTQQWLCEIYAKFGGQVFQLLDLHSENAIQTMELSKSIVSMSLAVRGAAKKLLEVDWDIVIIDEAHHLLASPPLYRLAQELSRKTPAVLLLSALPAQRREDEFLQLLALLEPDRFASLDQSSREAFRGLYGAQREIGRRLRIYSRRLEDLENEEGEPGRVVEVAKRFLESPILSSDIGVVSAVEALDPESQGFVAAARDLRRRIAEGYRINRRLLRNRRARLIDEGEIEIVRREFQPLVYEPGQPELDAVDSMERLVRSMHDAGAPIEFLISFARLAFQALSASEATLDLLTRLDEVEPAILNDQGRGLLNIGQMIGYADWDLYADLAATSVKGFVDEAILAEAISRVQAWKRARSGGARTAALIAYLRLRRTQLSAPKIIVFVGYPGRAAALAECLRKEFGKHEVEEFRHDLPPGLKEEGVQRFRTSSSAWLLVSDETGGEGRNFQFASELVHVDTPWNAARIEQRIGRLDRLGRERTRGDVRSVVLHCLGSPEAGLIHCYNEGLGVYRQSISGLEFGLRTIEDRITETALCGGAEALIQVTTEMKSAAEDERARDDGDALLDEGSFDREAAERFRRVGRAQASEKSLEESFVRYVDCIASVKAVHDSRFPTGIWKFSTESRFGALPQWRSGAGQDITKVVGTFRREIAQLRPDLQFFTLGNPFFETVVASLDALTTGRTYAATCLAPGREAWVGFEFVFKAIPNLGAIHDPGILSRVAEAFPSRWEHIFVGADGVVVVDSGEHLALRRSLVMEQKGRTWQNLTRERAATLPKLVEAAWQDTLHSTFARSNEIARDNIQTRLARDLKAEHERIAEAIEEAGRRSEIERAADVAALESIAQALGDWSMKLDGVGFLAINVGLSVS